MLQLRSLGVAAPRPNKPADGQELRQAMVNQYHPAVDRELNELAGIFKSGLARIKRLQQANAYAAELQRNAQERD